MCTLSDDVNNAHNHPYHRAHNIIMFLLDVKWGLGSSVCIVLDKQEIVVLSSAGVYNSTRGLWDPTSPLFNR